MSRPVLSNDLGRTEEKTGIHLLMAGMVSIFSILLILITLAMGWETWTIPLMFVGILAVWVLHIGRMLTDSFFEYLCTGILTIEFFYYGVHKECLYEIPIVVCVLFFMLSLLNKKKLFYLANAMYALVMFYHLLFLHTIGSGMGIRNAARLGLGVAGAVSAMVISGTMVNRRKEERKRMQAIAQQLDTARQQNANFLSNVSHELRTPINMVTGISEVALGKRISSEMRDNMQSIQMAGKRLAGQINDILDYTEIVGNTLVVTNERYMPSSVINDVITAADMQNGGYGLEMVFDMDTHLPAVLIGDAEKITRTLRILLQNAIKFTMEGGIYVYVGYRQESYGVNLDITICDTGIGMSAASLSRIYDDFFQEDSGRSRYAGGLGLGIPIARGLIHAMEGFIHYSSTKDQGTQVHISIPQKVADDTPCMEVSAPKQLCIACYFKQDKYSRNEVRQYYDAMIRHLADGLGIEAYRAYHIEDFERIMNGHKLTHLFLAQEEYVENVPYFEELGKTLCIVLIANKEFRLRPDSSLILLQKPFCALPIVNLLNGETHGRDLGECLLEDRAFTCVGVRALVVDDEEMNLVVARGILNSYDIQVETCTSGAAAIEQCMGKEYGLIFLDHMMPGMDGVETLKRIRALKDGIYQNLPIIALTANAISGAREMFKGEGFTEFVPKPIERPLLERALRKVLPAECIKYYTKQEPAGEEALIEQETADSAETAPAAGTPDVPLPNPPDSASEAVTPFMRLAKCGINIETGLSYCGGDEEFYMEMLRMYVDSGEEKRNEIIDLYQKEDWEDYAVKVHALKSTSLTIGAEELSEQAKALEQAGKDKNNAFIKKNHDSLIRSYKAVCGYIADCMETDGREGERAL